jgi:hypothetical protein
MMNRWRIAWVLVVTSIPVAARSQDPQEWGTLEGRVTWKGDLPKIKSLEAEIRNHKDGNLVLDGGKKEDLLDPAWRIDAKTNGVANVCVFLKRPVNKALPIHANDKKRDTRVVVDAPFTIFVPHVVAYYPEWFDGQYRGKTGEKLIFKNSSSTHHCFKSIGNPLGGSTLDSTLPPGKEVELNLKPQLLPRHFECSIRTWASGYVWVFDHPYYAITKADGTFSSPRVPAGMEVHVLAWHEVKGWLLTKEGAPLKLKAGKNVLDLEMGSK